VLEQVGFLYQMFHLINLHHLRIMEKLFLSFLHLPFNLSPLMCFVTITLLLLPRFLPLMFLLYHQTLLHPNMSRLVGFKCLTIQITQHLPYWSHITSNMSTGQKMNIGTFSMKFLYLFSFLYYNGYINV